mmetsp:Transcript_33872/g.32962  ORF Transcript_33872/g.32962 Transcript_33872/m.32962 type:complete len:97 (-) Transcript_33872:142-432(-)
MKMIYTFLINKAKPIPRKKADNKNQDEFEDAKDFMSGKSDEYAPETGLEEPQQLKTLKKKAESMYEPATMYEPANLIDSRQNMLEDIIEQPSFSND